jgi:alanine racemase
MAQTAVHKDQSSTAKEKMNDLRPAYLEINLKAFVENIKKARGLLDPSTSLMAVVKANAYGHGLIPIAQAAEKSGVDFLGVAIVEEGEKLREAGIKTPIVVLYPDLPERAKPLVRVGLIATACSWEYLESLNKAAGELGEKVEVFLKLETGMGRFGLPASELKVLAIAAQKLSAIKIIGVSSNLADSSNHNSKSTVRQFAEFKSYLEIDIDSPLGFKGIENSGGLLYNHHNEHNLVRIGILLYGISPNGQTVPGFMPVMSLKSRVVQIKKWPSGRPIGYGGHFVPKRDSLIATIPIGYADGYPWSLSNKGVALISGARVHVIGKVCMDAIMLDVTDIAEVKPGDEVVLLGPQGNEIITADELAKTAGSFPYELLSRFSERLPRVYKDS